MSALPARVVVIHNKIIKGIRDLAKDSARSLSICLCNGQGRVKHLREGGGPGGKGGAGVGPNENCQVPTRGFPSRMSY
jgi:hypothetical protein